MSILSLSSASDLLSKCEFEIDGLKKCNDHPEYDYLVINCVMGVNHLFEWFIKDKSNIDKAIACINKFNPFQTLCDVSSDFKHIYKSMSTFPACNEKQEIIRRLCNKTKHFNTAKTIDANSDVSFQRSGEWFPRSEPKNTSRP